MTPRSASRGALRSGNGIVAYHGKCVRDAGRWRGEGVAEPVHAGAEPIDECSTSARDALTSER